MVTTMVVNRANLPQGSVKASGSMPQCATIGGLCLEATMALDLVKIRGNQ